MNQVFENQLSNVIKKFPNLSIKQVDGENILKGILDIYDEGLTVAGSFSVEIHPTEKFPYRFPKLFEVGGDIPCDADYHKFLDNSCCITVLQEEILKCYKGITLIHFLEKEAIPYFANQLFRKQTGHFMNEYPHGKSGVRLFYAELFKSSDMRFWLTCLKHAFSTTPLRRKDDCYCNSGKKYKKCHLIIEKKLQIIGKLNVINDINWLMT